MKLLYSFLFSLALVFSIEAQQSNNMTLLGKFDYEQGLNDVWGFSDKQNNEYAIVGLVNGTSIVDVTNPASLYEVAFIPGPTSVWRDIKTYGNYAYVVHDSYSNGESQGLLIIDLHELSNDSIRYTTFLPNYFSRFHNLYIDENGFLYLFGGDFGNGGVLIYDILTNPEDPILLGSYEQFYLHDGMVRGDTLWGSAVYAGMLLAIDVSNKSNPVLLGSVATPNNFTHNAWVSDDGSTVFTTDEVSGAYIAAVDVSDVSDMTVIDQIQSWSSETNVIPHNTHVLGSYLVTSYYCDGVTIVDASDPSNLHEVAYYDTSDSTGGTFSGAWGAYPYLPSGNILVSDRQEGLHVLSVDNLNLSMSNTNAISRLKINPNPSATEFLLSIDRQLSFKVYAIDGSLVESRDYSPNSRQVSIGSNWKPGVYILKASDAFGILTSIKLVKT